MSIARIRGVSDEEDGCVVPHEVVVLLLHVELDGDVSGVPLGVGGALRPRRWRSGFYMGYVFVDFSAGTWEAVFHSQSGEVSGHREHEIITGVCVSAKGACVLGMSDSVFLSFVDDCFALSVPYHVLSRV